jgi:LysR family transcriptional regulator, glycine cleavage system transcriptional activator
MQSNALPPLNALRTFLVAARHQSFTRAAVELNVTHGAVSRQVRSLEDFLGIALFERQIRQVTLTVEGQQLFAETSPALDQIGKAARALMGRAPVRAVRINVRPSFAVRWLIPRLSDFVAQYPGIEPQVATSTRAPDRAPEAFDIAIRRSVEGWPPSFTVRPFLEDALIIVGAPSLLQAKPVTALESLSSHILLACKTRRQDWDDWKKHLGITRLRPAGRLQFDHLHFVLQAAVDSLGLALTPTSMLGNDMASGRLASPMPDLRMPLTPNLYGISPEAGPETHLFARWLGEQARRAG